MTRNLGLCNMKKELRADIHINSAVPMDTICPTVVTDAWMKEYFNVTPEEVQAFESGFADDFVEVHIDTLFRNCRKCVVESIVTPLGLGKFIAMYDRVGGNVDTIHNSRQMAEDGTPIGTEKLKKKYAEQEQYDSYQYHGDPRYRQENKAKKGQKSEGTLKDTYTGLDVHQNMDIDQDHVISAKEIHDDPGRVLASINGPELANDSSNLAATSRSINRSKKAKTMSEFIEYLDVTREQRQEEISVLKDKPELTNKEKKVLKKLEALEAADVELMTQTNVEARKEYNKTINNTYYTSKEFYQDLSKSSAVEGIKLGFQQALGLLLVDVSNAFLDELVASYRNGFISGTQGTSVNEALRERLVKIGSVVFDNWNKLVSVFKDGVISGIVSNIITTLINTFLTTAKNIVRIIREGSFVLLQATKTLLFPTEGITLEESWDTALKLIVGGALTIAGISLGEVVSTLVKGLPFANTISAILAGMFTGIATACALYAIDRWDPFGVYDKKKRRCIRRKIQEAGLAGIEKFEHLCMELGISAKEW